MKSKCTKCQQIIKASGVSYLKCRECKQKASDKRKKNKKNKSEMAKTNDELRKISKRLNQDSINKFIKERNGLKAWLFKSFLLLYTKGEINENLLCGTNN